MACAPPMRSSRVTPASSAAAMTVASGLRTDRDDLPHAGDGAGIADISSDEGSGKRPAGHVAANALERLHTLLDLDTPPRGSSSRPGHLTFRHVPDVPRRRGNRARARGCRSEAAASLHLLTRDIDRPLRPSNRLRIVEQRLDPRAPHAATIPRHASQRRIPRRPPVEQRGTAASSSSR